MVTNINFFLTISIDCPEIRLWQLINWSPKRKCLDLLSNSLNPSMKEMYRDQFGEFVCGYEGPIWLNLFWWMGYERHRPYFVTLSVVSNIQTAPVWQGAKKVSFTAHGKLYLVCTSPKVILASLKKNWWAGLMIVLL